MKEGFSGKSKTQRERQTVWRKETEEKQFAALMAKSELNEQGRQAVIMADPI